jgi:hypothetical protein
MKDKDTILLEQVYANIQEMAFGVAGQGETQERISKDQLIDIIGAAEAERPGTNFIGVTQITKESTNKPVPDPTKPARGQDPLYPAFELPGLKHGKTYFAKVTQLGGQTGQDYERSVQKATGDQTFQSGSFKSGMTRVGDSKVILQKPEGYYIQIFPTSISKDFDPVYVSQDDTGGFQTVAKQDVQKWKKQYGGSPVTTRTVSIHSIAAISINGKQYAIEDLDPVRQAIYDVSGAPLIAPAVEAPEEPPTP